VDAVLLRGYWRQELGGSLDRIVRALAALAAPQKRGTLDRMMREFEKTSGLR
jgi:hypothetical protein